MSRLVARPAALAQLATLSRATRLLTIAGQAGVGKSTLAVAFAKAEASPWHLVSAGRITRPEHLVSAIASAIGAPPTSARTAAQLTRHVGRQVRACGPIRLVLDGFEHLVASAGPTVVALLGEAPEAAVLVTSRALLGLPDELHLDLGPLGLPASEADLEASEAGELFLARAAEAGASVDLERERAALHDLVRRLEGIPLAIEIAAARLDAAGVRGVLERLQRPSAPRPPGAASSQAGAVRATVAWSWDLLGPRERDALLSCAVFRGGFTPAAAEQVLSLEPAHERLAALAALRDRSLLHIEAETGASPRYVMPDAVRELALEELAAGPDAPARYARHDAYFLSRGAELARRVDAAGDVHARETLARELPSVLDVLARALERASAEPAALTGALEMSLAADAVHVTRATAQERLALWDSMCDAIRAACAGGALEARARARRGSALAAVGEVEGAIAELDAALALALASDRPDLACEIELDLGIVLHARRDYARAHAVYTSALGRASAQRAPRVLARITGNLGAVHHDLGRTEPARRCYAKAVELAAAIGDARVEGIMHVNLAVLEQEGGNEAACLEAYARGMTLLEQAADARLLAIARANRAMLSAERGSLEEALHDLEVSVRALRAIGEVRSEALAVVRLGAVLALVGRVEEARAHVAEADAAFARLEDDAGHEAARLGRAFVALARGEIEAARAVLSSPPSPEDRPAVAASDDVRALSRVLASAIARLDESARPPPPPGPEVLVVSPDGARVRPPKRAWRSLSDQPAAARVLAALADRREASPGDGVEAARLIEIGWPGEALSRDVGRGRLYAAIARIRAQGLDRVLVRQPDGYLLDPAIPFARWSER